MSAKVISKAPAKPKRRLVALEPPRVNKPSSSLKSAKADSTLSALHDEDGLNWEVRLMNPPRGQIITVTARVIEVRKSMVPSIEALIGHES